MAVYVALRRGLLLENSGATLRASEVLGCNQLETGVTDAAMRCTATAQRAGYQQTVAELVKW
jgi:hypothetical protein